MRKIDSRVGFPIVLVTIFLFIGILAWFLSEALIDPSEFLKPNGSDVKGISTIIYETRSIASYGIAVIVSSVTIFVPLLTLIWTNAKQTISTTLDALLPLLSNPSIHDAVEENIGLALKDIAELNKRGEKFKPAFLTIVFFSLSILVGFLFFINMQKIDPSHCYRYVTILFGLSIVVFLSFISLFGLYQFHIRPFIAKYEDRKSYSTFFKN